MDCVCHCNGKRLACCRISRYLQIWQLEGSALGHILNELVLLQQKQKQCPAIYSYFKYLCSTYGFNILSDFCKCFFFQKVLQELLAGHRQLDSLWYRSFNVARWDSSICAQSYLHNWRVITQTAWFWLRKLKDVKLTHKLTCSLYTKGRQAHKHKIQTSTPRPIVAMHVLYTHWVCMYLHSSLF